MPIKALLKKISLLLLIQLFFQNFMNGQSASVSITANRPPSGFGNSPLGISLYSVNESIYTAEEIGAATFGSNPINHIDYLPYTIGEDPVFDDVKIYMKNVSASTVSFAANGTYSTAGYTLVYNGSIAYVDTGFSGIDIIPFNYIGTGNLQMMVEKTDGREHRTSFFHLATGNSANPNAFTLRYYNNTTPLSASTNLQTSIFRPAIRLSYIAPGEPPVCAQGIVPADAATNVPTNPVIEWTSVPGANSYDVYFGTTTPAPFLKNQFGINFTLAAPVLPNTKYYYRIVAKNNFGSNPGCSSDRSFTTGNGIGYCTPKAAFGCGSSFDPYDAIRLVVIGDIYNASDCAGTAFTNYSSTISTNLIQGSTNPISVTQGMFGDGYLKAWIDYNDNGSFDDDGELVFGNDNDNNFGEEVSGNVVIPVNAPMGPHRLRVRTNYFSNEFTACSFQSNGETEDYNVNIVPPSAVDAALTSIVVNGCAGTGNVDVTLKNNGGTVMAASAATVKLYIKGATTLGPLSQSNPSIIPAGQSVVLSFPVNFNLGTHVDSAFIVKVAGDNYNKTDTIKTTHNTVPLVSSLPMSDNFETNANGWYATQLSGEGNWAWSDSVYYPSLNPKYKLLPKSGSKLWVFDSYNFNKGTKSRLTSPCIALPANANSGCGYVAGFYFTQDAQSFFLSYDSVVLKIKTSGSGEFVNLGKVNRYDSSLSAFGQTSSSLPVWKLYTFDVADYAGETVQFALDAYGLFGNQFAIDSFFVGPKTTSRNVSLAGGNESGLTLTPASLLCDDKGWTYYAAGNSASYLFGIQWDPASTGANASAKTFATAALRIDTKPFTAENGAAQKATYTMQRYWDVNLNGATMSGPVNIRFFYSQKELDLINNTKTNFINAHPGSTDKGIYWFKQNTGSFAPSASTVTADGVINSTVLTNINTTGTKINGVLYAQFNGLTNFGGGTAAAGVGLSTSTMYTFTGTGNWSNAANWSSNIIPPDILPAGSTIEIDHAGNGQCILDIPQTISAGATLTVKAGKKLVMPAKLIIK